MMRARWLIIGLLGIGIGTAVFAQDPVTISGTRLQTLLETSIQTQHGRLLRFQALAATKQVSLLQLTLSQAAQKHVAQRITTLIGGASSPLEVGHYPRTVQLAMNKVPVLDQGEHGTCMLFALTAAVDALLGKGDYVSQLCHLGLSNYLNQNAYSNSGWEGGWGEEFVTQMRMFGIVPKTLQHTGACAGRQEYPLAGGLIDDQVSVFDYHQISESLQTLGVNFSPLILEDQLNSTVINRDRLLYQIKGILHQGDRVTCAALLMGEAPGDAGPTGTFHMKHDTWVLLPHMADTILKDPETTGHAFVITGYDDDAVATDARGRLHRGLLTLRNSWGSQVGDQGNFYMTYTYFKAALLEAHRVERVG